MNAALVELALESCTPRQGPEYALSVTEVAALLAVVPGWATSDDGKTISKSYGFKNYYRTMAFVNAVAWIAHREDHHPDLVVSYNQCLVRYSTHDVGGLSRNDFICAAKVEALLKA